jgi:hypothetical protein
MLGAMSAARAAPAAVKAISAIVRSKCSRVFPPTIEELSVSFRTLSWRKSSTALADPVALARNFGAGERSQQYGLWFIFP